MREVAAIRDGKHNFQMPDFQLALKRCHAGCQRFVGAEVLSAHFGNQVDLDTSTHGVLRHAKRAARVLAGFAEE